MMVLQKFSVVAVQEVRMEVADNWYEHVPEKVRESERVKIL